MSPSLAALTADWMLVEKTPGPRTGATTKTFCAAEETESAASASAHSAKERRCMVHLRSTGRRAFRSGGECTREGIRGSEASSSLGRMRHTVGLRRSSTFVTLACFALAIPEAAAQGWSTVGADAA